MVAIVCLTSSLIQHAPFVNDGPICSKIDDKKGNAVQCGSRVTDGSLPWRSPVWVLSLFFKYFNP